MITEIVLVVFALPVLDPLIQQYWAFCKQYPHPTLQLQSQEFQFAITYCSHHTRLLPYEIMGLLVLWSSVAIEIKRWHDRGMSGFWVLLRLVNFIASSLGVLGPFLLLGVGIFQFIQLGCCGSAYYAPPRKTNPEREGASGKSVFLVFFGGFIFLVLLVVGAVVVGGIYRAYHPSAAHRVTSHSPMPVAAAVPVSAPAQSEVLPESAYQGTANTTYGHDWVIIKGTRVGGIIAANPAPHAEVALLNSNGGQDVPAASLPQGFLDDWKLTPERLKAADNP